MPHLYPENQTYGIINTSDLASVDFTQVMPNQSDEVRYSLDGLMFVIKWEEDHEPTFITDGTIVPVSILTLVFNKSSSLTPRSSNSTNVSLITFSIFDKSKLCSGFGKA